MILNWILHILYILRIAQKFFFSSYSKSNKAGGKYTRMRVEKVEMKAAQKIENINFPLISRPRVVTNSSKKAVATAAVSMVERKKEGKDIAIVIKFHIINRKSGYIQRQKNLYCIFIFLRSFLLFFLFFSSMTNLLLLSSYQHSHYKCILCAMCIFNLHRCSRRKVSLALWILKSYFH